jgi:hypothetical protein
MKKRGNRVLTSIAVMCWRQKNIVAACPKMFTSYFKKVDIPMNRAFSYMMLF